MDKLGYTTTSSESGYKVEIKGSDCGNCGYWHLKSRRYMDKSEKYRLYFDISSVINALLLFVIVVMIFR